MRTYLRALGRGGGNPPEIDVAGVAKYVTGCSDSNRQRRKGKGGRRWEPGGVTGSQRVESLVLAEGGGGGESQKGGWVRGGAGVGWGCPRRGCSSNLGMGRWVESGAVGLVPNTREGV